LFDRRRLLFVCLMAGVVLSAGIGSAETAAPPAGIELDDPWLTERGPVLPEPSVAPRADDRVRSTWASAPATPHARAAALRRLRLELGLGDLRAPAEVVRASLVEDEAPIGTQLALDLAPAMPALRWAQVRDLWRDDQPGAAAKHAGALLASMGGELESQLWLIGNGLALLLVAVLGSSVAFIAMLAARWFFHAAHDLGDLLSTGMPAFARAALLAGVLLIPLALGEGVAGLVLAGFAVAFLYGSRGERSALAMAAVFFVVAVHPLARWTGVATSVVDLDPVLHSALSIVRGTASPAELATLEAAFDQDVVAAHALAQHARRQGDAALQRARLDALAARVPADPVVLTNLGNLEMRAGRTEAAIDHY